jgi:hypothetical protein
MDSKVAEQLERIAIDVASPIAAGALRLAAARVRGDAGEIDAWRLHLMDLLAVDLRRAGRPRLLRELALERGATVAPPIHETPEFQHAALSNVIEVATIRASLDETPYLAGAAALAIKAAIDDDELVQDELIALVRIIGEA